MKLQSDYHLLIDLKIQKLSLYYSNDHNWKSGEYRWNNTLPLTPVFSTLISSAKNGVGQMINSYKTPLGRHIIRAKIGSNVPINSVFVGRRLTGEIWHTDLEKKYTDRDWILTRIFWLSGLEKGFNRQGNVDTMKRYIYIHGSPPNVKMGEVGSKGCVRMNGEDIIKLFNIVPVFTTVNLKYL